MIYLDNAATTPMSQRALETMLAVAKENFGNPSSIHGMGRRANQILRQARQTIADYLKVAPSTVIFTSGGTESNNLAIRSIQNLAQTGHIITSAMEHHSVLHTMEYMESQGYEVTYLKPLAGKTVITAAQVQEALRSDTLLVSIMYANNETGSMMETQQIGQVLEGHRALFHVDAVQVFGKISLEPRTLGIDFLSASGHKFHGPKGVGLLYSKNGKAAKLLFGGDQEDKRRAGTENLAGIAAMAEALAENQEQVAENLAKVASLREALISALPEGAYVTEAEDQLPHVINLGYPGSRNELLLTRLDMEGIAVSTGSACTAGAVEPSHVLAAIYGKDSPRLRESIRVSLSEMNNLEEVSFFLKKYKEILGV